MSSDKQPPGINAGQGDIRKKPRWQEYGESIFIALALALIIRAFLVQAFSIPSGSMEPTLLVGDYLLVNKFAYGIRNPFSNNILIPWGEPQRGDVVVFIYPMDPTKDYIKRVIGLPGDRIQIINKKSPKSRRPRMILQHPGQCTGSRKLPLRRGTISVRWWSPRTRISSWGTTGTTAMTAASGVLSP